MSDEAYPCGHCGGPTVYQSFSGGKEYYCPGCGNQASYDMDAEDALPRATLLQTEWGQKLLRAEMDIELDRLKEAAVETPIKKYEGDLTHRLWRAGAQEAWQAEQSLERAWEFAQEKEDDAETWFSAFASWRAWALKEFTRLKERAKVAAAHVEGDCSATERLLDEYTEEIRKQGAKIDGLTEELELAKEEAEAHSGPECMAIAHALEEAEQVMDRDRETIANQAAMIDKIQDMLSYLDLHMAKFPITQLTTEQKELYANLVDAGSLRSWEEDAATDRDDPEDQPRTMERWWR